GRGAGASSSHDARRNNRSSGTRSQGWPTVASTRSSRYEPKMSFFSNLPTRARPRPRTELFAHGPDLAAIEHYRELIALRPALLDEKLKLRERIPRRVLKRP